MTNMLSVRRGDDSYNDSFVRKVDSPHIGNIYAGLPSFPSRFADRSGEWSYSSANHQKESKTNLFGEFLTALRCYPHENQVLDLAAAFHQACHNYVQSASSPDLAEWLNDLLEWERNTWSLLFSLYKDRLETIAAHDSNMHIDENLELPAARTLYSEKEVIDGLYNREATVREMQIVVDWLERLAKMRLDKHYADQFEFFVERTIAWEDTFHLIKTKRPNAMPNLVSELDPDAACRSNKQLSDIDKEHEQRLLRYLFLLVRAGEVEKAQQVCMKVGQSWRAAMLEGWKPFHDPNLKRSAAADREPVEGNPSRDLWKKACWDMAKDRRVLAHEKALLGALSGNLDAVLPVCESLEDYLWSYFKVALDVRVEREIRGLVLPRGPVSELPDAFWSREWSLETLFQQLEAATQAEVTDTVMFQIVKNIIIGDTNSLVDSVYKEFSTAPEPLPKQALRFMAHLIIFFNRLHLDFDPEQGTVILEAFVAKLIEDHDIDFIAFYVSQLPRTRQVMWYTKFLVDITGREERERCIQLAKEVGLDVADITRSVVTCIRSRGPQPDSGPTSKVVQYDLDIAKETLSAEDRHKIDSIEWLIFDPKQRAEALRQANAVGRYFLAMRKFKGARELCRLLPADSLTLIHEQFAGGQTGEMDLRVRNCVREHLCLKAYLDAMDAYQEWFEHFYRTMPAAPDETGPSHSLTFTEKLAREQRLKEYAAEREQWKHMLELKAKMVVTKIEEILTSQPGWLVDEADTKLGGPSSVSATEQQEAEAREHQMQLLRQKCVPALVFLLVRVLNSSGEEARCIRVADLVASERYQLYKLFRQDQLQQLLSVLRTSSVALLNKGLDPLGYKIA